MMKLLQISALSALTLLFAACEPGMIDGDVEGLEFQSDDLDDLADVDAEDEDSLDDFADASGEPAPAVAGALAFAAADDDGGCDTAGDDDDIFADSPAHQGALDGDRDLADAPQGDDGWGPEDFGDVDDGDAPGVGSRPLGDRPDSDDSWGPEDFSDAADSDAAGFGLRPLSDRPEGDEGWGPGDFGDVDADDDGEPAIDIDTTLRDRDDEDDDTLDDLATA